LEALGLLWLMVEAGRRGSDARVRPLTRANLLLFTALFRQTDDGAHFSASCRGCAGHNEGRSKRQECGQQQDWATVQHLQ
jgi:hypothetical protein